jgi:uncharacterized membrane protein
MSLSSGLFYAGFSLLILAFLLWIPGKPWVRTPSWQFLGLAALLAYGIPATFFIWTIHSMPDEATRMRVSLLGLGFRTTPGNDLNITIGGDQAKHEVWVKQMQANEKNTTAGQLKLRPPSSTITLQGSGINPIGILAYKNPKDGSFILPNAIELINGDQISFKGKTWEVRFEPRLLGTPQIEFHNTQNQTKVLLPGKVLPVDKQTYPIDNLLGTGRTGLTGFFYRQKDRLFLATLKSDIKIERPGNNAPNQKDWEIASTGTQLHVLGIPHATRSTIAKGVRDWRSFMVKAGQQSLLLQFDSPEIHTLAYSDLEDIRITTGDTQQQTSFRVNLALGDWDKMNEGYIHLHNVSRQVGGETSAILELQDTLLKRELESFTNWEQPLILTAPGGQQQISNGEPAWIGENNMAAVQMDLLEPPMQLALLTLLLVIAKMLAAISARLSALHLLMAGAIELFVIFRVLLGYRVWILPPFEDQAMIFALTAWAFLPWAFIVASLRNYKDKQQNIWGWLPAVSGLVFSAIWCYQINGGEPIAWAFIAIHVLVLLIPFFQFPDMKRSFAQAKTMPWHQSILSLVPKNKWMTENPWLILAMLLGFVRIILFFFGAREAIYIGMRIPLSIIHIPLGLIIEAGALVWFWRKLKDKDFSYPLTELLLFSLIPLFIWLPAAFAGDYGLLLLNVPVFIIVSTWLILTKSMAPVKKTQGSKGKRRLYYTLIVGVFYVFPLVLIFIMPKPFLGWVPEIESIPEHVKIRFLQYAYPEKLEALATIESERHVHMTRALEVYTSKTNGHGYAKSESNPSLKHAQLREYALAIFIAGDWGTWGVIGLMLVYLMIAVIGASLLPWRSWYQSKTQFKRPPSAYTDTLSTLAGLAALTFAFSSLYMILVNYNLLPFTGRNVYLFGLESGADILESFILLAIVAFGAATIRDKEAKW